MAKQNNSDDMMERIRENYQSIILGFIVFLIAAVALYRALGKQSTPKTAAQKEAEQQMQEVTAEMNKGSYTVKKGDTLWKIAESHYGSGYNAADVARANRLSNPNRIEVGQTLTFPDVTPKMTTKGMVAKIQTSKVTITGDKYTVQKGDHLWKIAVGAYGDGYAWGKIAKENKLRNPNRIVVGQVLRLAR